jgi:hypothetical protein
MIKKTRFIKVLKKRQPILWMAHVILFLAIIQNSSSFSPNSQNSFTNDFHTRSKKKNISPVLQRQSLKKSKNILSNNQLEIQEDPLTKEDTGKRSIKELFSNKIGILKIKKFGKKKTEEQNILKKHHNKNKKMLSVGNISYKKLMKRKQFYAKNKKKIEKLKNLKKALTHKRIEQKANLISDRTLLNLINQRVITNDLFNSPSPKNKDEFKNKKKPPKNTIESEMLYNKKTDSLAKQVNKLDMKIQELQFHQMDTKNKMQELMNSESKRKGLKTHNC